MACLHSLCSYDKTPNVRSRFSDESSSKSVIALLILNILSLLMGVFLIFSTAGMLPDPLNITHSWKTWGYVAGGACLIMSLVAGILCCKNTKTSESVILSKKETIVTSSEKSPNPTRSTPSHTQKKEPEAIIETAEKVPSKVEPPPILSQTALKNIHEQKGSTLPFFGFFQRLLLENEAMIIEEKEYQKGFPPLFSVLLRDSISLLESSSFYSFSKDQQSLFNKEQFKKDIFSQFKNYLFLDLQEIITRASKITPSTPVTTPWKLPKDPNGSVLSVPLIAKKDFANKLENAFGEELKNKIDEIMKVVDKYNLSKTRAEVSLSEIEKRCQRTLDAKQAFVIEEKYEWVVFFRNECKDVYLDPAKFIFSNIPPSQLTRMLEVHLHETYPDFTFLSLEDLVEMTKYKNNLID